LGFSLVKGSLSSFIFSVFKLSSHYFICEIFFSPPSASTLDDFFNKLDSAPSQSFLSPNEALTSSNSLFLGF
jgi:hypothetical protein